MSVTATETKPPASQRRMIRLSEKAHGMLKELSEKSGESMQSVLEKAVDSYRRERFFEELNAAYAALRADPEAWAEESEERKLWEATLMDGLEVHH